jgi:hypothetical protein
MLLVPPGKKGRFVFVKLMQKGKKYFQKTVLNVLTILLNLYHASKDLALPPASC